MRPLIFSLLACTTFSNLAFAETTLSLKDARARAQARAPEVALATTRIAEAEATRVGAGIRLPVNPRVSFDVRPGLDRPTRGDLGYAAGVDLLFDVSGAPGARLRESDARVKARRADATVAALDARLRVTEAYVRTALGRLRIDTAREAIALGQRLAAAARERLQAGAGSDVEVSSAETELAERTADLHAAEIDERLAQIDLRDAAGLGAVETLQLTSAVDDPPAVPDVAALLAGARERRPDLARVQAEIEVLSSTEARLTKEARPKVGLYGSIDASPASPVFGVAGLSFELPFAQRNQGPRAIAAAERRTEETRLALLAQRLELEITQRRAALEAARSELTVLTSQGLPSATRRVRLVEEGWKAGRFDVFRVTTAAQDVVRLNALRIEAIARIWNERLALERLTGGWSDE